MLTECKSCTEVSYCSVACREAWAPIHAEFECPLHQKLLSLASDHSTDGTLLKLAWRIGVFATLEKRALEGSQPHVYKYASGTYEDVLSLVSHMEHYEGTDWSKAILACSDAILALPHPADFALTAPDILGICARINSNAHALVPEDRPCALGLFVILSQMNHSCQPNITFSSMPSGPSLNCRATRNIKAGEEITISYIDVYQTRNERRELLQLSKFFTCLCPRCTEPLLHSLDARIEGFNCTNKACTGLLVRQDTPQVIPEANSHDDAKSKKTNKKGSNKAKSSSSNESGHYSSASTLVPVFCCNECGKLVAAEQLDHQLDEAKTHYEVASNLYRKGTMPANDKAKQNFEGLLSKFGTMSSASGASLCVDHWLLFNTNQRLANCCVRLGDVLGSIRALKAVASSAERILPLNDPETANYLVSIAEAVVHLEKNGKLSKQAMVPYTTLKKECLTKAVSIRKIALGADHIMTKQALELLRPVK